MYLIGSRPSSGQSPLLRRPALNICEGCDQSVGVLNGLKLVICYLLENYPFPPGGMDSLK